MNCTKHEEREAAGICVYCGKFFCQECLVELHGQNYCREHIGEAVDKAVKEKPSSAAQPNIIINNSTENVNTNTNAIGGGAISTSPKSRTVMLVLCIFLGVFGGHRFYAGKIGTGILYLLTAGFCGVGVLIDMLLILLGSFRDSFGLLIKQW